MTAHANGKDHTAGPRLVGYSDTDDEPTAPGETMTIPQLHKSIAATVTKGIIAGFAQIDTDRIERITVAERETARLFRHVAITAAVVVALVFCVFVLRGIGLLGHVP